MKVAQRIDNYFPTPNTKPHTWAWGDLDPVTLTSGHARINVPVGHTNIWEFGAALEKHPLVCSVIKGGG